jgi:hypothetical protein
VFARAGPGRRRLAAAAHGVRPALRDGRDLTAPPLRDRRAGLKDSIGGSDLVFPMRRLAADGHEAWRQVVERGDEGLVPRQGERVRGAGLSALPGIVLAHDTS